MITYFIFSVFIGDSILLEKQRKNDEGVETKVMNSKNDISGIHHITAICSDPQKNIDFYTKLLGLRLVKLTVNFDDPSTYHLYYGDEIGQKVIEVQVRLLQHLF